MRANLNPARAARILGAGEGPEAARLRGALDAFRSSLRDEARAKGSALRERRGGAKLSVVMLLARWMPGLLWRAYQYRRKGQAASHGA